MLAVSAAKDLPARLVLGFEDESVNRLLDIDSKREAAFGLVSLGVTHRSPPAPPGLAEPLDYRTVPLSRSEVNYPAIWEMHRASSLADSDEVVAWRSESPEVETPKPSGELIELTPVDASKLPREAVEDTIRRRGSTRRFARVPISFSQLSTLLQTATTGIPADGLQPLGTTVNDLYLIVNDVDGLPPGAYFYDRERRAVEKLKEGDFRQEAGYLDLGQILAADASVNIYMMSDLDVVLSRFGNRGYRLAQLEGGILGGKVYLGAYAQKLGATGLTFYDDEVTNFFSPHGRGKSVMFLVALGRSARQKVLHQI
jgi:SagB-type dehydrogenase family enzyme